MENNAPNWNQRLSEIPDFTMDLTWEFSLLGASWIPFVGSFLFVLFTNSLTYY